MSIDFRIVRRAVAPLCAVLLAVAAALPQTAAARPSGIGLIGLGDGLATSQASALARYNLVIVGQQAAHAVARFNGRAYLYACGVNIPQTSWSGTCGVPWETAVAKNWLLRDASGNYVPFGDGVSYLADVGNPAYQRALAEALVRLLSSDRGVDGVMVDNVSGSLIQPSSAYPSNAAYRTAMRSLVVAVSAALRAHHRTLAVNANMSDGATPNWQGLFGNACDATQLLWWYRRLAAYVDVFVNENWEMNWDGSGSLRFSGTSACTENWDGWQRLLGAVQRMRKTFVAVTSGGSDSAGAAKATYLRASFLLDYDGGPSAFIYAPSGLGNYSAPPLGPTAEPWNVDVGRARQRKHRVGVGWRRDFGLGVVLIDPSSTTAQTFSLGGVFRLPDGTSVRSITLQPGTAAILRAAR